MGWWKEERGRPGREAREWKQERTQRGKGGERESMVLSVSREHTALEGGHLRITRHVTWLQHVSESALYSLCLVKYRQDTDSVFRQDTDWRKRCNKQDIGMTERFGEPWTSVRWWRLGGGCKSAFFCWWRCANVGAEQVASA